MLTIKSLIIHSSATIRDAMACIELSAKGVALLVDDEGRFLTTVTDGDLRRAILSGHRLETPIMEFRPPTQKSVTAPVGTSRSQQIKIMMDAGIRHLPLLDSTSAPVELAMSDELLTESEPVQAVIMAGGFGKRLRPLTDNVPKPMLSVGGKPLMERTIESLQQAGIRRINVTTHYMPEKITGYFGNGNQLGVELSYVSEDMPLGTAGALRLVNEVDDPILVMNGDILTNIDYRSMLDFHRENSADLTVAVRQYDYQVPYGVIEAEDSVVKSLREKPKYQSLVNAGIYLLEPTVRRHIPLDTRYDMTDLIDTLLSEDLKVVCFPVMEYWLDIGQPEDFAKAQEDVYKPRWAA
ncbi:D-glycero-alpha-D-manno-heptose 1-phosphate guanylyltransferase [Roseimaritima multifibrata]|uniref:D-glycero-alpha-D-manno-heptose 1-phosphate guanylyltransferase n=1 Tax=Roseimaritima multifibrata TaxID=1930274 RepID=A0A517MLQ7_9BACT|nr:nucleotidyltransferase family protein [Roseimaritima multifibrata]QDS95824.1 D-glycero-alpha-D-manno-heptose 1-phosphate guanylyltransferase [Roseimaritima multifibrata]